jgi:hypothetical protein
MLEANVGCGFALADYSISLDELEQKAGLRFGDILHEAAGV